MRNAFPGAIVHATDYYGYPNVGSPRRIVPRILQVVHTTETYSVPYPGPSKSWTFSVERDGTVHQFMDPVVAAPWTNGDLQNPDLGNPIIAQMMTSNYNPNEFCFVTVENVNRIADGQRLTAAQLAANRAIAAWALGLFRATWPSAPIARDRTRVIGHYQVNGNTRVNCPTVPADRDRVFNAIIEAIKLPDTGVARVNIIKDVVRFRTPRRWTPKITGTINGYNAKGELVKSNPMQQGVSGADVAAVVSFSGDNPPGGIQDIWMAEVPNGYFAGQYVNLAHISVDGGIDPDTIVKEVPTGITQAQLDAARLNARDQALRDAVAAVQAID